MEDIPVSCPDNLEKEQENHVEQFLQKKSITAEKVKCTFVPPPKKRTLSSVIAGKPVTEESVVQDINIHLAQQKSSKNTNPTELGTQKRKTPNSYKGKGKGKRSVAKPTFVLPFKDTTRPGPSAVNPRVNVSDSEDENVDENDCCCICKSFYPPQNKCLDHIVIVNWGQCSHCSHWTHLSFCSPVRVLRMHSIFLCPHCDVTNEQ